MEMKEKVRELMRHPLVLNEMALQVQLGLPYLEERCGKLCMSFRAHREELKDGNILFYPAEYDITWIYPFQKVIHFNNLHYAPHGDFSVEVGRVAADWMVSAGKLLLDELYDECDKVINAYSEQRPIALKLEKYQALFRETLQLLNMEAIYGERV